MANTNDLKTLVEPYVRGWLTNRYYQPFEEMELPLKLITGGKHRFDIISKSQTIVGGIKTTPLRESGRVGTGAIKSLFTELYFLSLVKAERKLLILTDKGFYELFKRRALGKVLPDTEIIYCELPKSLSYEVAEVHKTASKEIGKRTAEISGEIVSSRVG
ncbi:MAG: hypothetical protein Q8Q89_04450 [bacterium]|nr:hypothetical protein [bacterium]